MNSSHFATDLGKGASDKLGKRFRVLSLNDNVSWMTALANDYSYEDVFAGQLQNYGKPGDVALGHQRQRQLAELRESDRMGEEKWLEDHRARWWQTRTHGRRSPNTSSSSATRTTAASRTCR